MERQQTVARSVGVVGIGLHTGRKVALRLHPAPPGTGVRLVRVDCTPPVEIALRAETVTMTRLCTGVAQNGVSIATVEHLLSALSGVGVDNVIVEVDGPEVPIMDGSAAPFVWLLEEAGLALQEPPRRFLRVVKPVKVVEEGRWACLSPYDGFRVTFTIDFSHPAIRASGCSVSFERGKEDYLAAIGRARTFGFVHEVEALRGMGLARGGSFENAIVLDEFRVLNPEGLRYSDEFARHKVLDAIGDLAVAGAPLLAHYEGYKSGHALNNRLLRALMADPSAWVWTEEEPERVQKRYSRGFGRVAAACSWALGKG
ncbi:MAG: UDP-3-O-acyl-N-acetylglucosamine deacetylase [Hydrogenophilus sp.]|nr:UDP-3-O-acyl-N-acetylglucosamine deacetylase [Hydrogenophilus sp.]